MLTNDQKAAITWIAIIIGTILVVVASIMLLTMWGQSGAFEREPTEYEMCIAAGGSYEQEQYDDFECTLTHQA